MIPQPFQHQLWQETLMQWVDTAGNVNFGALALNPKRFNEYLAQLANISPDSDPEAFPTVTEKAAYWINAHNALVLRVILDYYPLRSLTSIPDLEDSPRYILGGRHYTLSQIRTKAENYPQYPFIRLFLTDYTTDTPPIRREAYEGNNLEAFGRTILAQARIKKVPHRFSRRGSHRHIQIQALHTTASQKGHIIHGLLRDAVLFEH